VLVGDSVAMVVAGRSSTIPATLEQMVYHGEIVARATTRAMVVVDDAAIDGSVNGLATGVRRISDGLRGLQTGFARSYALSMLAGTALFAGAVLIMAVWR
jgi:NADH-quinone oxidoreductase subunit L